MLCCVLSSLPASMGEGQAPPELLLGAPPTVLTVGAGTTGATSPRAAVSGAGLLGISLSKNVFSLHRLPQVFP